MCMPGNNIRSYRGLQVGLVPRPTTPPSPRPFPSIMQEEKIIPTGVKVIISFFSPA